MGIEIERKYLVKDGWKPSSNGNQIIQGYLTTDDEKTIRVRIKGGCAFLTIKGKTVGISRSEFEYEIPVMDAKELLKLCGKQIIEKVRYEIEHLDVVIEVDVFKEKHDGLILAEIELESENQIIELPDWIGEEVSMDSKYYNSNLANE